MHRIESGLRVWAQTLRSLAASRGFLIAAVATLALGIGANAAVFSVLRAVVLASLPYPDADRIVTLSQKDSEADLEAINAGWQTFADWREQSRSFDAMAAYAEWSASVEAPGGVEMVQGMRVTQGFFATLGVAPALGRDFDAADDTWDGRNVVVLDHDYWMSAFAGDRSVVGREVRFDTQRYLVIGVLPKGFSPLGFTVGGRVPRVWAGLGYEASKPFACRTCRHLMVIARLRAGASLASASEEMDALAQGMSKEYPQDYAPTASVVVKPLHDHLLGPVARGLWLLFGAVALIALVASANVGGLFVSRSIRRARELAIRSAIGGSRAHLVGLALREAMIVGVLGGLAGFLLARLLLPMLLALAPEGLPRLDEARLDLVVFGYALAAAVAAGLFAGLIPAAHASRIDPASGLRNGALAGLGGHRALRGLIRAQTVLCMVVLVCGALLGRSFGALLEVDPGLQTRDVLVARVVANGAGYDEATLRSLHDAIVAQAKSLPLAEAAALVTPLPFTEDFDRAGFHRREVPTRSSEAPDVDRFVISPNYFDALQVPVARGRAFDAGDRSDTAPVAIINQTLAATYWPNRDPLGAQIQLGGRNEDRPWLTVVGVVGDVRQYGLDRAASGQVYIPIAQSPQSSFEVVVRGKAPLGVMADGLREQMRAAHPGLPTLDTRPLSQLVDRSLASRRFALWLLLAFGALATLLVGVGAHGLFTQAVAHRTAEIGLRAALGATATAQVRTLLRWGAGPVAAGVLIGVPCAYACSALIADQLYSVSTAEPTAYLAAIGVIVLTLGVALMTPAHRALSVSPMQVLRQE